MIKFRLFSKYDEVEDLKRTKDSDILDREEKGRLSGGDLAAIGGVSGGLIGMAGKKGFLGRAAGGAKGALIGAGIGVGIGLARKGLKKREENEFYNQRLNEAKRSARRREREDWEEKMSNRSKYE